MKMEISDSKNEQELTSNTGNVLSTSSKVEKTETGDSTPTSSTDAYTNNEDSASVPDDPISSTSCEVKESQIAKEAATTSKVEKSNKMSDIDADTDLLGMEEISGEKITEDVEDLVHDLESLLGESTESFNISNIRKKDVNPEVKGSNEVSDSDQINLKFIDSDDQVKNIKNNSTVDVECETTQNEETEQDLCSGKNALKDLEGTVPKELISVDDPNRSEVKDTAIISEKSKDTSEEDKNIPHDKENVPSVSITEPDDTFEEPDSQQDESKQTEEYAEVPSVGIVEEPTEENITLKKMDCEEITESKVSNVEDSTIEITEVQCDTHSETEVVMEPIIEEPNDDQPTVESAVDEILPDKSDLNEVIDVAVQEKGLLHTENPLELDNMVVVEEVDEINKSADKENKESSQADQSFSLLEVATDSDNTNKTVSTKVTGEDEVNKSAVKDNAESSQEDQSFSLPQVITDDDNTIKTTSTRVTDGEMEIDTVNIKAVLLDDSNISESQQILEKSNFSEEFADLSEQQITSKMDQEHDVDPQNIKDSDSTFEKVVLKSKLDLEKPIEVEDVSEKSSETAKETSSVINTEPIEVIEKQNVGKTEIHDQPMETEEQIISTAIMDTEITKPELVALEMRSIPDKSMTAEKETKQSELELSTSQATAIMETEITKPELVALETKSIPDKSTTAEKETKQSELELSTSQATAIMETEITKPELVALETKNIPDKSTTAEKETKQSELEFSTSQAEKLDEQKEDSPNSVELSIEPEKSYASEMITKVTTQPENTDSTEVLITQKKQVDETVLLENSLVQDISSVHKEEQKVAQEHGTKENYEEINNINDLSDTNKDLPKNIQDKPIEKGLTVEQIDVSENVTEISTAIEETCANQGSNFEDVDKNSKLLEEAGRDANMDNIVSKVISEDAMKSEKTTEFKDDSVPSITSDNLIGCTEPKTIPEKPSESESILTESLKTKNIATELADFKITHEPVLFVGDMEVSILNKPDELQVESSVLNLEISNQSITNSKEVNSLDAQLSEVMPIKITEPELVNINETENTSKGPNTSDVTSVVCPQLEVVPEKIDSLDIPDNTVKEDVETPEKPSFTNEIVADTEDVPVLKILDTSKESDVTENDIGMNKKSCDDIVSEDKEIFTKLPQESDLNELIKIDVDKDSEQSNSKSEVNMSSENTAVQSITDDMAMKPKLVKSLFDTPNSSEASSPAVVEINDSTESDLIDEVKVQKVDQPESNSLAMSEETLFVSEDIHKDNKSNIVDTPSVDTPLTLMEDIQKQENEISTIGSTHQEQEESTQISENNESNFTEKLVGTSEVVTTQLDFQHNLETLRAIESLKSMCDSEPYVESTDDYTLRQAVESISKPASNTYEVSTVESTIAEVKESSILPDTSGVGAQEDSIKNSSDISDETQILTRAANAAKLNLQQGKLQKKEIELEKPLSINVDDVKESKPYSPKLIIKPVKVPDEEISTTSNVENENREPLKMTITKQSDKMHSILKIYNPNETVEQDIEATEQTVPKLIIKTPKHEQQPSPKMTTRSSKTSYNSPTSSTPTRSSSPRVTAKSETVSPLKITIKTPIKCEESKQKHSPKLIIKPVVKSEDDLKEEKSPKLNIKPIKSPEEVEQVHSPKIRIKPIPKPDDISETHHTPRLNIKLVKKPDSDKPTDLDQNQKSSPKVTIKPVIKPQESEVKNEDDEVKERIVLKINKGNLSTPSKESRKREHSEEKSEKLKKIKLKFSKEGGHPHIVQPKCEETNKRTLEEQPQEKLKKLKTENEEKYSNEMPAKRNEVTVSQQNPQLVEEVADANLEYSSKPPHTPEVSQLAPVTPTPPKSDQKNATPRKRGRPRKVPLSEVPPAPSEETAAPLPPPSAESGRPKRSCRGVSVCDALGIKPRKPRGGGRGRASARGIGTRTVPMKPVKEVKLSKARLKLLEKSAKEARAQEKKELKEKDQKEPDKELKVEENKEQGVEEKDEKLLQKVKKTDDCIGPLSEFSSIPVPSFDLTADDSNEVSSTELATPIQKQGIPSSSVSDTSISSTNLEGRIPELGINNSTLDANNTNLDVTNRSSLPEIAMFEEETRMSAEASSRAQTPARQVVIATPMEVEESQSSIQSTATVESGKTPVSKGNKGSRLEVHHDPDTNIISADQLAEYYWNGNGPFMLQEQVAQFLGIKSFKRKYPNIQRRFVDMQERDFIRESGLASEAMCDLGLTAVCCADILDIMYSDFQDKYEEYCKHQRDRQAKELINKQKALSLAATQEKNKLDITEQAVHSAASWNTNFNKMRREQRKASMDLQTLTVHYPKGRIKQLNKAKIGSYPVSLVPGQFTDFYQEYTPTEINNLPINTMCYDPININVSEDSDSSGSDSDSDSSSSDSSSSGSCSGDEDCKLCIKQQPLKKVAATSTK